MKIKKISIFLLISIFLCNSFALYGQESNLETNTVAPEKKSFLEQTDFIIQIEPSFYLSPESKASNGNVLNDIFPITFGALWPNDFFISFQPTINFFLMHHLWHNNFAIPAEIENRTTTTLAFMLNLPAVFSIDLKPSKLQLSTGLGVFLRFGLLAPGVNNSDSGESGSAGNDVKFINTWFWEKAHWLYLTLGASWLYPINSKIQIGPALNAYIPLGTLITEKSAQGMIFSLGIKLCL